MCTHPIVVNVSGKKAGFRLLPCGKCNECAKKYQNDWMIRLNEQFKNSGSKALFVTLTYRDETIPTVCRFNNETGEYHEYYSVCKRHVQDWFKRFRTNYERATGVQGLKFFCTSEYGPRSLRPHYHILIFGIDKIDFLSAKKDWEERFGFTYVKKVNESQKDGIKACKYVSKYCSKGEFENPYIFEGLVEPNFHLMSKSLGVSYVDRMKNYHLLRDDPVFSKPSNRTFP